MESGRIRQPPCRWDTAPRQRAAATMEAVAVAAACGRSLGRGGAESGTALKSVASVAGACRVHRRAALLQHRFASSELQGTKWSCTVAFLQGMPAMPAIPAPLLPCELHCIPCEAAKRIAHCGALSEWAGGAPDAGASRGSSTFCSCAPPPYSKLRPGNSNIASSSRDRLSRAPSCSCFFCVTQWSST